jgi:hypothetical protein
LAFSTADPDIECILDSTIAIPSIANGATAIDVQLPYGNSIAVNPFDNSIVFTTSNNEIVTVKNGKVFTFDYKNSDIFSSIAAFKNVAVGPEGEVIILSSLVNGDTRVFFLLPAPIIADVSPHNGPVKGGNNVTITGFGFRDIKAVRFGGAPAESFEVNSDKNQIIAVPAPGPQISLSFVEVVAEKGTSNPRRDRANAYEFQGPLVRGINPAAGSGSTVTIATITGSRLNGTTLVSIGSEARILATPAPTNTQITVEMPRLETGEYPVIVTTPEGSSDLETKVKFVVR